MIAIMFWSAIGLVVFSYVVYPSIMYMIGRFSGPVEIAELAVWPTVAVVVAAYNEEQHIGGRIRNLLEQNYEPGRIRIYVGSDGSSDRTLQVARDEASDRVHVFPFEQNRGKASVLNDLLGAATEEIVVFTDANTSFHPDAVRMLVRHFADPAVGAVSGELVLGEPVAGDNRDSRYWRFETMLKRGESVIGGLLGANGGIYAIRRELYRPIATDTIVDDFTIAMDVAARGYQVVFDSAAKAFEDVPEGIDAEFKRRVRIGIGNYQAFFRHPEYWTQSSWTRRFTYLSHKVLRWFTPHLLIAALILCLLLAQSSDYRLLFTAQVAAYGILSLGLLARLRMNLPKLARVPVFIYALNVAFLIGFLRYLRGNYSGRWRRTERS